jgi:peptidoglycan/xylan/chitin deacetylase (PgdA/CDA1 family)
MELNGDAVELAPRIEAAHSGVSRWARTAPALRLQGFAAGLLKRRLAYQATPRPIISFTFDDFPRSALTAGGEILGEYGVRGTYYVAMGLVGKRTAVGEMFGGSDLERLAAAGHELACHTLEHTMCCDLTVPDLVASCRENQRRIAEVLGQHLTPNFSFPEGVVTVKAKAALSSMYTTCRTIEPGVNRDPVDLAFLRAYRVYSTSGMHSLRKVIRGNRDENGWIILYTHDVGMNPSAYGCTPADFREVVRCAADSGADILPVAEAVRRFRFVGEAHSRR